MTDKQHDESTDEGAAFYDESINRIKKGVEQGMTFEQAVSLVGCEDQKLKAAIVDDTLKVIIAEMHFMGKQGIDDVAKKLRLPAQVIMKSRQEMLDSVEAAAIEAYKDSQGQSGNA